jgi:hypothetical protein
VTTLRFVVILTLVAALAGCEKNYDLPRLQDEALATAKAYQVRLDELAHRAEVLRERARPRPEVISVGVPAQVFRHAVSVIEEYRRTLQQVPGGVQQDVATGDPKRLHKRIDGLRERFEHAVIEATSELDAVESALALAEQGLSARGAEPGSDGSAAPIR